MTDLRKEWLCYAIAAEANSGSWGGYGGAGLPYSLNGQFVYYGGGGCGNGASGAHDPHPGGTPQVQSGVANTGAGRGGDSGAATTGGSGTVMVKFKTPP